MITPQCVHIWVYNYNCILYVVILYFGKKFGSGVPFIVLFHFQNAVFAVSIYHFTGSIWCSRPSSRFHQQAWFYSMCHLQLSTPSLFREHELPLVQKLIDSKLINYGRSTPGCQVVEFATGVLLTMAVDCLVSVHSIVGPVAFRSSHMDFPEVRHNAGCWSISSYCLQHRSVGI